ncbi:MAG: UDP-3-O-(3-hydroxymyristoyl) glucosamine N-acyltransferase [Bacteroidetes bacterium]|jgi:UDP-3-O-[3-hydroxymyristoyl] glucosamine N-acyltransferase|nr:UDP-3-O-(3-hydroxymyristoyl) glucosamine N-acyltransferase [Bacteroidota bacterium]
MKLSSPHTLKNIASIIQCEFEGDPEHIITGLNEIHMVESGDIVFVDHPKYYDKALTSKATTILINKKVTCPEGKGLLVSDDPFRDYNKLVRNFYPLEYSVLPISPSAKIGKTSVIMPGVYLGNNVTVGENCVLHPNVVVYDNCHIGNNVIIHSGTVIGADAFYYKKRATHFDKMISCGSVVIEDHVEIGALCTIDKGVSGETRIGEGTKIDNHVQIGHDTQVGKMCLFASHVGVAGVVKIEDGVTLWGQSGVRSDVTLGKGSVLLAQAGLGEDIEAGKTYFGSPAGEARAKMKEVAALKMLPDLIKKINEK